MLPCAALPRALLLDSTPHILVAGRQANLGLDKGRANEAGAEQGMRRYEVL